MSKFEFIKRLKKNLKGNSGMALVTVIVAIGFVAALVSILLTTTLVNFKMKAVNDRGKDTFYSAEQVLDEISVGLQRVVSDALSSSYMYVLENYEGMDSTEKNQKIQAMYYNKIWELLSDDAAPSSTKYSVAKLNSYLKESTKWHSFTALSGESGEGDGYGAIITAVVDGLDTVEGDMYTYTDGGVVLKNVKVYYKDVYGFVSVIQTDIRLNYPGFEFAKNSAMADITSYSFIADGGVTRTGTGDLNIDGNVYANNFESTDTNVTVNGNSLFIVKHDIDIKGKNKTFTAKDPSTIWAKNLISSSAALDISGSLNLSNDLNLKGDEPSVKIKGTYNGYGNSSTDADKSSAILINGYKSTVDFKKVEVLNLYGRAFLGMSSADKDDSGHKYTPGVGEQPIAESYHDLYTGESVAVKADQLMYLVPAEAIGVDIDTGRSIYNKNPLTAEEFGKIKQQVADGKAVMISDETPISTIGGGKLVDYIKYDAGSPKVYTHQVRVNDDKIKSVVYFYMQFGDKEIRDPDTNAKIGDIPAEQVANDYFNLYYNFNKDISSEYANVYIKKVDLPRLERDFMVRSGQSYVSKVEEGVQTVEIWPETSMNESAKNANDSNKNTLIFKAYTTKLIPSVNELGGLNKNPDQSSYDEENKNDADGQIVFENIVCKPEKLEQYIDKAIAAGVTPGGAGVTYGRVTVKSDTSNGKRLVFTDDEGSMAVVSTGDVTINSTYANAHLVISLKDVTVTTTEFNGVILCNGKIKFEGTSLQNCKKAPDEVAKCLQYGYEDSGLTYAIASCLEGGNDYIYSSYGDAYSGANSLEGLVSYENWKKE